MEQFQRLELLIGVGAVEKLKDARVAVFGLGGVGSYVVEALARSGVGELHIVDKDVVDVTNINRQLYALGSTVGMRKTEVARKRILDINPSARVVEHCRSFNNENFEFPFVDVDYIVDAIDDVDAKIALVQRAKEFGKPIICAMGAGNKLEPTKFRVADISETHTCPLAKVVRKRLAELGISGVKTVFSTEKRAPKVKSEAIASCAFVPSVAGLIIAGEVVKDLIARA